MEVTLPRLDTDSKTSLASKLTEAYAGSTGMDRERIGIRFLEYGEGETAYAGRLDRGAGGRPYVHVVLYCPRQSREVKQEIVRRTNAGLQDVLALAGCRPVIHIQEHAYDNVGVDGELLSDRFPELVNQKFYYPLDRD
jgi:4-oxalocrotonate tautomerase